MLRKRLITVLTFNDGVLFRTRSFHPDYRYTLNFVDAWSVDEIVILDITRDDCGNRENFYEVVSTFAEKCFVPLAVGGKVKDVAEAQKLLRLGADKIVVNSEAVARSSLITDIAKLYGAQCAVVSIDTKKDDDGCYEVMTEYGKKATGLEPSQWAKTAQEAGAGEIMITSIEKDGTLEGYDNELNSLVSNAVTIPVLVCGGAGKWQDFVDGFNLGHASAVCTTNIYHFTDASIRSAKEFLINKDIEVRK